MTISDLDRFDSFNLWDFDDFDAYLVASDNVERRLVRLCCDIKDAKLIVISPVDKYRPETNCGLTKEKAFEMLCANEFPSK